MIFNMHVARAHLHVCESEKPQPDKEDAILLSAFFPLVEETAVTTGWLCPLYCCHSGHRAKNLTQTQHVFSSSCS